MFLSSSVPCSSGNNHVPFPDSAYDTDAYNSSALGYSTLLIPFTGYYALAGTVNLTWTTAPPFAYLDLFSSGLSGCIANDFKHIPDFDSGGAVAAEGLVLSVATTVFLSTGTMCR